MKQRGRKQNLSVVNDAPISAQERPEPTADLTPEQRIVWITVVNSLPAEWFRDEAHGVLSQYCKHVVAAQHVAELITDFEAGDDINVSDYDKLLKMQERESRMIASLGTKLRITPQSTWSPQKTKGTKKVKSPWDN